jgi:hypothetical protein
MRTPRRVLAVMTTTMVALSACAAPSGAATPVPAVTGAPSQVTTPSSPIATTSAAVTFAATAGNPQGKVTVPAAGRPVKSTKPTRVIGNGTPQSCTSVAVVAAVAKGGIITFRCGPNPVKIVMEATAKVRNTSSLVVLDGGGKVTLSGDGKRRILYQNTCDQAQVWTTSHCQNQSKPRLVVQNLTFADGNSTGQRTEGGGGGAIFVRGGQFSVVNSTFVRNRCDSTGPDLGGAAIRVLSQYKNKPVYVTSSTFGGAAGQGGVCSNGGALSSIGVSWVVLNSLFTHNTAIGNGANPKRSGTPGGGSGGAIYADGNKFDIRIAGTRIENNHANEGGGAIFFVSNNRTGKLRIESSTLKHNPSDRFSTRGYPGIFFLGSGKPKVTGSKLS